MLPDSARADSIKDSLALHAQLQKNELRRKKETQRRQQDTNEQRMLPDSAKADHSEQDWRALHAQIQKNELSRKKETQMLQTRDE